MKLGSLDAIQCVYIIIIFFFIRKFLFSKSVNFHTKQIGRKLMVIVVQSRQLADNRSKIRE